MRHPRPRVAEGVCYGATDLPIEADPDEIAVRLRALLPAAPLFSSPLARCRKLAEALHAAPILDERIRELDFGEWEMRRWDDIDRAALDAWAADPLGFAPPGGESVAGLRERVAGFLRELPEEAILVTHAGVMKLCVAELAGAPADEWFGMRFDYGSVTLVADGVVSWRNRSPDSDKLAP